MSSPLTDQQFLKIKELRLLGMSYEKIAKQMKMSRNTVTFHAKSDITPSQRQQAHPRTGCKSDVLAEARDTIIIPYLKMYPEMRSYVLINVVQRAYPDAHKRTIYRTIKKLRPIYCEEQE